MEQHLLPIPRVWLRATLLGFVLVPLVVATAEWSVKISALLLWTAMLGSYRVALVDGTRFRHGLVVCFVPRKRREVNLERIDKLVIDTDDAAGVGWLFVVGPLNYLLFWVFDWLFPWIGGRYRVWLVSAKGRRVLAWQGNSDDGFRENLRILESATGCTAERTGFTL